MIERYAKNLDINCKNYKGGYDWINPFIKGVLIEHAYEVGFIYLYPQMILKLKEGGFLEHIDIDPDIYRKVQYYIDNRTTLLIQDSEVGTDTYQPLKKYVNSIFNVMGKETSIEVITLISQYMHQFYRDLIKANESNILYIDTDVVYFANSDYNMLDIDLPYESDTTEMVVFENNKKYTYLSDDDIITRGFNKPQRKVEVLKAIKEGMRNRKIDKLLFTK